MEEHSIRQVYSQETGPGLPFGIVGHQDLMASNDLFEPTLRDFHVIFWFKQGNGSYFVDFQEYHFRANSIVLLAKDQVSYFAPFDDSVELQSIVFTPDFIYRNDSDLGHLFQFSMSCHLEGIQIIDLPPETQQKLQQFSDQMREVFLHWQGSSRENAFYHWLSLFLLYCEQLQQAKPEAPIDEQHKRLLHFNQLLEANFKKEFKVEFYLQALGIPIKALSKLTKEAFKLSPKSVINERRLLEIKRQLSGTSHSTKFIAYELGFDEPTNMSKFFKKHTGMSPVAFRETFR